MPPKTKSVRYIPKQKVVNAYVRALANGDEGKRKTIYNSLSQNEKNYLDQLIFNMKYNNMEALKAELSTPATHYAAPNENSATRASMMRALRASGSRLNKWTRRGGAKKTRKI